MYLLALIADLHLLIVLPGYSLPDGQGVLHLPAVDQVDPVTEVLDLILPDRGVYSLYFADFPVGHADDTVGEGFQ